ncbi:hypothetical protein Barb6_01150 [Bacteroidales bacterium Barb6]|nr:hypothetical protein Barb6XT_00924 [Bacteroidales bacterium Barb6XT]OAV72405.1 hypothetical protein Barb6_01150 [Bacteroidales bacterium Barb6]
MSQEELQKIKQKNYAEAIRYMEKAKKTLEKAGLDEDHHYNSCRKVRNACKKAHHGVLIALDTYLLLNGMEKPKVSKKVDDYIGQIGKIDKQLSKDLDNLYHTLYMLGCHDGIQSARVVEIGFDEAYEVIDKIKPTQTV